VAKTQQVYDEIGTRTERGRRRYGAPQTETAEDSRDLL